MDHEGHEEGEGKGLLGVRVLCVGGKMGDGGKGEAVGFCLLVSMLPTSRYSFGTATVSIGLLDFRPWRSSLAMHDAIIRLCPACLSGIRRNSLRLFPVGQIDIIRFRDLCVGGGPYSRSDSELVVAGQEN